MKGKLNPTLVYWLQVWGSEGHKKTGLEYPSSTQEGRLLDSPGRGSGHKPAVPRYEPNEINKAVEKAVGEIEDGYHYLLYRKYRDGASDKRIALFLGVRKGKVGWEMEKAHREVAKVLKIRVYR